MHTKQGENTGNTYREERDTHPVGAEIVAAADPTRTACRELM
jgi:hypothetical protein